MYLFDILREEEAYMRWRLTYVTRQHGISEDEAAWVDTPHIWNMDGVESNNDAAEKANICLERAIRLHGGVERYELVCVVQEEVSVPVRLPPLRSYSELKWGKKAS